MTGALSESRRDLLFDYACAHPTWTIEDVARAYDWELHQVNRAIRHLRLFLGEVDEANLVCNPTDNGRWTYQLIGRLDDVRGWAANRVNDSESRIRTIRAVLQSIVNGTDGRSAAGRRALIMHRQLSRLVEDLDELADVTQANGDGS